MAKRKETKCKCGKHSVTKRRPKYVDYIARGTAMVHTETLCRSFTHK